MTHRDERFQIVYGTQSGDADHIAQRIETKLWEINDEFGPAWIESVTLSATGSTDDGWWCYAIAVYSCPKATTDPEE